MKKKRRSAFLLESLEARLLFSADLAPLPVDGGNSAAEMEPGLEISLRPDNGGVQASDTNEQGRREVIFVDEAVDDIDQLTADLESQREKGRQFDIVGLDSDHDGIAQISDYLRQQQGVDAVHILSHGTDGEVILGNSRLNATTLDGHAEAIEGWQQALSGHADLLFYGCNLAAGDDGQDLVNSLALLSGADVAASDDVTGSAKFGGDWVLEYGTGEIETEVAVNGETQQNWNGVLATFTVNTTADTVDVTPPGDGIAEDAAGNTSLRAAIMEANALGGATVITLNPGTYNLTLGELGITSDLTITGMGAGVTTIDGGGLDRVFHINFTGNATITNLTIQNGGNVAHGGGIRVSGGGGGGRLNLDNVIVCNNTASVSGGGIFVDGVVTLTDVEISGNTTSGTGGGLSNDEQVTLTGVTISGNSAADGAGIFNSNQGVLLSLTNVTISGNTAAANGGGIYTARLVNSTNVTIASNLGGGGIYVTGGLSDVELKNSILADNTGGNSNNPLTSLGYNIEDGNSAFTPIIGDQPNTDPLLSPLQSNGGFTQTHLPLGGSPVVDAGAGVGAPAVDQLGTARPLDGDGDTSAAVDIGAVEVVPDRLVNNPDSGNPQETLAETRGSLQAVAMAANGNYVVVWSSLNQDGSGWGVFGQRFDALGSAVGSEFQVNDDWTDNEYWATVAMDAAGNFVVAWTADNQDSNVQSIYARGFNADATEAFAEFKVNTHDASNSDEQRNPSVAMAADGRFVIAWEGVGPGESHGIFFRRFNAAGTARDAADQPASNTDRGTETTPAVAINDSGEFAITWEVGNHIYVRPFGDNGGPIRVEDWVDVLSISSTTPDVAIDSTGRITVAWRSENAIHNGIWMKTYSSTGFPGFSVQVDENPSLDSTHPSITMDSAGNRIVVYEGSGDGDGLGVFARKYDDNGLALTNQFQINQTATGTQHMTSVAMLDTDNYVVVWSGNGPDDSNGVFARQFGTATSVSNDAPVLADDNPTLTAINEDDFTSAGDSVAAIVVDGSITDPDGSPVESIAITAVDDTNGTWQYSTDNGATWANVDDGALAVNHALLLDGTLTGAGTHKLRFVPTADYNGTATFTFRAWDQSSGSADTYADSGATTAFSSATDTAAITINALNDAPVLADDNPTLTAINEDDFTSAGDSVAAIVVDGSITDPDGSPVESIAITAVDDTNGTWQYSTDNGATWANVDDGALAVNHALLLDGTLTGAGTHKLRFVPTADYNGTATFTFRAWDQSSGSADTYADSGATTAFSSATDTAAITINALNDAPVLADDNPTLTAINEDDFTSAGDSVAAIVVDGSITDPDGSPVESIAITAVDDTNGTWQYSTDNGATWANVDDGALAVNHALLLDGTLTGAGTHKLRFVPTADYNGTATFTFRAWDQSSGSADTYADSGATTAFSSATDTAAITINALNDAPTITSIANTAATEDLAYSYTFTVNDVDVGDTLTLSAPTLPTWLSFDPATGILSGTPTNAEVGDHAVVLRVNDGTVDVDQSFTITVANTNDAGTVTIDNTTPTQGDTLTANVIDPDGASGAISFQWFSDGAAIGGATGKTYTTTQADVGRVITVTAVYTDALGTAESLTSAGTAAVTNVNETPVTVNDHLNVIEDHSMIFNSVTDLLANDSDIDGDTLTISGFTQPANGTLADNGDGTFTYTPAGNFNGNDSFTYTISDGNGETATGTAIIVVTPIGDTPRVSNVSTNAEAQSGLIFLNRNANDGLEVTHFKLSGITNGTLYLADGVTRIDNGDFITVSQGQAGLRFTPAASSTADGSFKVESSEDGVSVASQSGIATSIITVLTPASQPSASEHSPPLSEPEPVTDEEVVEEESEDAEDVANETDVPADADNVFSMETPQTSKAPGTIKPVFNPGISFLNQADSDSDDDKTPKSSTLVSPQTLKLLLEAKNLGELKAALGKLDITTLSPDAYELMRSSLDAVKEEIGKEMMLDRAVLGSAIATSVGLSAGYVVWMLKGGSLLASVLSSLPVWQLADPLAILVGKKEEDDEEDDSLKTIIEESSGPDDEEQGETSKSDNIKKESLK